MGLLTQESSENLDGDTWFSYTDTLDLKDGETPSTARDNWWFGGTDADKPQVGSIELDESGNPKTIVDGTAQLSSTLTEGVDYTFEWGAPQAGSNAEQGSHPRTYTIKFKRTQAVQDLQKNGKAIGIVYKTQSQPDRGTYVNRATVNYKGGQYNLQGKYVVTQPATLPVEKTGSVTWDPELQTWVIDWHLRVNYGEDATKGKYTFGKNEQLYVEDLFDTNTQQLVKGDDYGYFRAVISKPDGTYNEVTKKNDSDWEWSGGKIEGFKLSLGDVGGQLRRRVLPHEGDGPQGCPDDVRQRLPRRDLRVERAQDRRGNLSRERDGRRGRAHKDGQARPQQLLAAQLHHRR